MSKRAAKEPADARTAPGKTSTETLHGLRAVRAVWAKRPGDVVRLGHAAELGRELADLLGAARARGVPVKVLGERELGRVALNHEGLVAEVKERPWLTPGELADRLVDVRGAALALDRVRNPYNVGALLRSAAFFGLDGVLVGAAAPHPALAPDAVRVAEGGAEELALSRTTDLAATLAKLRARGVHVLGAESDAEASALELEFPRPVVVVVGHEREGLSERVRAVCERMVTLPARPGGSVVGSLNVAITGGILCARLRRR
jgi:TrmH RNA methyltransferase